MTGYIVGYCWPDNTKHQSIFHIAGSTKPPQRNNNYIEILIAFLSITVALWLSQVPNTHDFDIWTVLPQQ